MDKKKINRKAEHFPTNEDRYMTPYPFCNQNPCLAYELERSL